MDYSNWLAGIAEVTRTAHAFLSGARDRVQYHVTRGGVTVDSEARLAAKLDDAICSLSSAFICADIAADEYWRLAQADED